MRFSRKVLSTVLVAGLISVGMGLSGASASSAVEAAPVLQTKSCTKELVKLAKQQRKALPSSKQVTRALTKCADGSPELPKAQFAAVTYKGRTVGAVFATTIVNGKTTLFYQSGGPEDSTTDRLLNGNGRTKQWGVGDAPVVVAFAGLSHNGVMEAVLGEGYSGISITLDAPFGVMVPERAVGVPAPGSVVNVYGDFFGYKKTKTGPVYDQKWATVQGAGVFGVVTDQQGNVVGSSILFGTGYSSQAEWKFWKNRSYLLPLGKIVEQSQGIYN